MRWLLLLLLSTGCRQLLGIEGAEIGEDASTAPIDDMAMSDEMMTIGHDEDGDTLPDTTDNCPTIANLDQLATPNDELVGTVCDPRPDPAANGDRIAAFFSFAVDGRPAELAGGNLFEMDHAMFSGGELSTDMQHTPTRVSIVVSNTALPSTGNSYVELRVGMYSCRLGSCSAGVGRCLQATGANTTSDAVLVVEPAFRLEMDQLGGEVRCRFVEAMATTTTTATANAREVETDRVRVRASGVTLTIDSFIIYAAP